MLWSIYKNALEDRRKYYLKWKEGITQFEGIAKVTDLTTPQVNNLFFNNPAQWWSATIEPLQEWGVHTTLSACLVFNWPSLFLSYFELSVHSLHPSVLFLSIGTEK